jgi:hypothetical protein
LLIGFKAVNLVNRVYGRFFIEDFSWLAHQEISQSQYFCPLHCRLILPKEAEAEVEAEVTQPGPAMLELLAARQEAQRAA